MADITCDQYLASHPLTVFLQKKYPKEFDRINSVRVVRIDGLGPSAWPLVSGFRLTDGKVPRFLIQAFALLKWSVFDSLENDEDLDAVERIVTRAQELIHADVGLKNADAVKKSRAAASVAKEARYKKILTEYARLKIERPKASQQDLVNRVVSALDGKVKERTVWTALRKRKTTASDADLQ